MNAVVAERAISVMVNPTAEDIAKVADVFASETETYQVANTPQYAAAGETLKSIKRAQKLLETIRFGMTRPMDEAKNKVLDFFRGPSDKLSSAEKRVKEGMLAYDKEQRRLQQEEQRKAEEAAAAERQRLAASAAKAEEAGRHKRAEEYTARAEASVAPLVRREPLKVAGTSLRTVWKFEIADAALVPREYLVVDETKVRRVVTALKEGASIPGVRVWSEQAIASGAL